jgi:hypothetical protein
MRVLADEKEIRQTIAVQVNKGVRVRIRKNAVEVGQV